MQRERLDALALPVPQDVLRRVFELGTQGVALLLRSLGALDLFCRILLGERDAVGERLVSMGFRCLAGGALLVEHRQHFLTRPRQLVDLGSRHRQVSGERGVHALHLLALRTREPGRREAGGPPVHDSLHAVSMTTVQRASMTPTMAVSLVSP
jgi:hypothetical protein